jgi:hypothetical protein
MLELNRSLLKREYILINVLKALGFDHLYVYSPCDYLNRRSHRDILHYLQMECSVHST